MADAKTKGEKSGKADKAEKPATEVKNIDDLGMGSAPGQGRIPEPVRKI